ncbi:universal stress protein [Streptomyces sp. NBC_01185]|uniref:universal stress protein n=1 Tax=Streptomyces sp. NBC_01185 TaxID=2903764 RepID=UPI003868D0F4|nr:universal stress protein [Streptomyces sp. NBC_01185]
MRPRVVVGVSGRPGGLTALRRAAAEARLREAELWAVLAWDVPGAGLGGRQGAGLGPSLLLCRADAAVRLRSALTAAFGAAGAGVPVAGRAVRGTPGAVLVDMAGAGDCLLVVGAGPRGALHRCLRPSVARYCVARAPCPVLAVPDARELVGRDGV